MAPLQELKVVSFNNLRLGKVEYIYHAMNSGHANPTEETVHWEYLKIPKQGTLSQFNNTL